MVKKIERSLKDHPKKIIVDVVCKQYVELMSTKKTNSSIENNK